MVGTEKLVDGDFPSPLPSTKRTEGRRHEMKVLMPTRLAWVKSAWRIVFSFGVGGNETTSCHFPEWLTKAGLG